MRSVKHRIGLATLLAVLGLAFQAQAGIDGSPHDFEAATWNTAEQQVCQPCHTPHHGDPNQAAPLWNHEIATTTYTLYSSTTLNAGPLAQPTGVSLLCLSCHDGTVAVDSYGGGTGTFFIPAAAEIGGGGTLEEEHPIGFTYDAALATEDGELFDPGTAGGAGGLPSGTIQTELLFSNQVECASCHDVHNTNTASDPLLRINIVGSVLCLTCHNK